MEDSKTSLAISRSTFAVAAILSMNGIAGASADDVVDPRIRLEIEHGAPRLVASHGRVAALRTGGSTAPVVIQLTRPADAEVLSGLEDVGVRLRRVGGRALFHGRFVPAAVDVETLDRLQDISVVKRVASASHFGPRPMDNSAELIGLDAAWGSRPAMDLLTGEGVVVSDIDGNLDIFHPKFFNGDGGYFDWIDVDHDGVFSPGVDAIDLNSDGVALDETGELLRSETIKLSLGDPVDAHIPGFDPSIDWLYIDTNGNDERDYGAAEGFTDDDPALGEPLFVPDDVNQNGQLDLGERVVRLGSSKLLKVFHFFEYSGYPTVNHVYERGVDFAEFDTNFMGDANIFDAAGHGSGVLSIIGGDVPLVGRRWVGISPDADLLLAVDKGYDATGLIWSLEEGADVVLHERANWFGEPLDGTDITSVIVDESTADDGTIHTCPVGNTGGSRKHAHVEIGAGETHALEFEIPYLEGLYYVSISLNLRGVGELALTLEPPVGDPIVLQESTSMGSLSGGAAYYQTYRLTSKGTRFHEVILYDETDSQAIPEGTWTLHAVESYGDDVLFDGYLMDDISGWGQGVAWDAAIASDNQTIGWPATSELCVAVGAHTGHVSTPEEPWFYGEGEAGEIRTYSGRGPTIDGRQKPDVAAPDNPWAAAPNGQGQSAYIPHGAVCPFGGTSGAGPHVTGVTALLAQVGTIGADARQAVRDGAQVDDLVGAVPNHDYGWGRLSAAGALGVEDIGSAPSVSLQVNGDAVVGEQYVIGITADDPDGVGELEVKWDDGYDGTWDIDYQALSDRTLTFDEAGEHVFKARIRDETGRVAEAIAVVLVAPNDAGPGNATGGGKGCGCFVTGGSSRVDLLAVLLDAIVP